MKHYTTNQGFVILFTILISSLVLLMALGIANVATKEVTLSIQSRDAARAFFAADAGMECALYADKHDDAFHQGIASILCNGISIPVTLLNNTATQFSFYSKVGVNDDNCVYVNIDTDYTDIHGVPHLTRITALGYNTLFDNDTQTCGENLSNPRRIERGYRATY